VVVRNLELLQAFNASCSSYDEISRNCGETFSTDQICYRDKLYVDYKLDAR
jgi:hypothetical protein